MKNVILGIALSALIFCGCAAAMQTIRTIIDIATLLCENAASDQPIDALRGQTPKQWCATKANLQPFIDQVTKAKYTASKEAGLSKP